MQRYILTRLLHALVALWVLATVVFLLARLTGDPVELMLPIQATVEDQELVRHELGLDKPLAVQYWIFLTHALRGDFGVSIPARRPALELVRERLPNSLKLSGFAMAITLLLAFPLGIVAAVKRGTPVDTFAKVIGVLGQSLPLFWLGIVLVEVFAVSLKLLPASGAGGIDHYILPGFTLGWFVVAGAMRLFRSSMLDVLDSEFIKMARIKGASETAVIWKHALRNALIPVITFAAMYFAILISAAIVVEAVFAWPGVGRLAYEAIYYRDFPVIQAVVMLAAVIVVTVNLFVDILYAYLDPRIRYG